MSWRDLWVIVRRAPLVSAIGWALHPERARWASGEVDSYLLAHLSDQIATGNWQRAGNKNAPRPKPIPRPGVDSGEKSFGSEPIPISEFKDWWESS